LVKSAHNTVEEDSAKMPTATIPEHTQVLDLKPTGINTVTDPLISYRRAEVSQTAIDSFMEDLEAGKSKR
jgi:hypothetical protein